MHALEFSIGLTEFQYAAQHHLLAHARSEQGITPLYHSADRVPIPWSRVLFRSASAFFFLCGGINLHTMLLMGKRQCVFGVQGVQTRIAYLVLDGAER